ncbi:MAG: GtrA family protein [Verrucomicrobiota bacterium]
MSSFKTYPLQAGRFVTAALIAALANLGTLYLTVAWWDIPYLIGAAIAFVAGFAVAFVLHKWWTFGERNRAAIPHQVRKL